MTTVPLSGEPAIPQSAGVATSDSPRRKKRRRSALKRGQNLFGWIFVSPALAILIIFLVIPIILALYISFTNWSGITSPFASAVHYVGLQNYRTIITEPGLAQLNFGTAVRNNFYYVIFVVPLQTALALWLAILVNNKFLKGKSFFRTAFYFPSVTSSIAITTVFIFLFSGTGAVNRILSVFGINGPDWLYDQNGIITSILASLGIHNPPSWANFQILGLPIWDWFSGPSFGMCVIIILAVWTTSGTFMLFFLAALQNISEEAEEASEIDGATPWQRFRFVTLPMLRPVVLLVATLGFIGTWQVFDQSFLTGPNNPTMVTPAFLAYQVSFSDFAFGEGAAIAFMLFGLIVVLTLLQRKFVKEDLTK
ncbi:MAG: sugar ABC transporter permease [Actinomycetota bacterium]|nr:sugar ABC transporter permease [Actinomycetota bacterium]